MRARLIPPAPSARCASGGSPGWLRPALAAVACLLLLGGGPGSVAGQDGPAPDGRRIAVYARAHAEIAEIRRGYHAELAQNHEAEAIAALRERVDRRIADVLRAHGLTREEYERLTFLVSTDREARSRLAGLLTEDGGSAQAVSAGGVEAPDGPPEAPVPEGAPARRPEEPGRGAAPVAPAPGPEAGITPEMVARGEALFRGSGACFTCHGEDARGGPLAPDLTDDEWLHVDGSYAAIVDLVTNGVPEPVASGIPMPPRGGSRITPEQIRAVAAYVARLSRAR